MMQEQRRKMKFTGSIKWEGLFLALRMEGQGSALGLEAGDDLRMWADKDLGSSQINNHRK